MNPCDVSTCSGHDAVLLLGASLGILIFLLLARRVWGRPDGADNEAASSAAGATPVHFGIDPSDYADADEQQAALERLSQLPQFRRLPTGTLVEWSSGAHITPCDCRLPPVPHLMIAWGPQNVQAIVSRQGLAHSVRRRSCRPSSAGPMAACVCTACPAPARPSLPNTSPSNWASRS